MSRDPRIKYVALWPDGGIVKGSDLWPFFFDTDPRLDRETDGDVPPQVQTDIVEVSAAI
jgi:hypothetical protein